MTNWDLLVENHFAARKQKPLAEILNQLIEQVMAEALDFGMPEVLGEEGETAGTQRTYTIDDIPLIPISELGWACTSGGFPGPGVGVPGGCHDPTPPGAGRRAGGLRSTSCG